MIVILIILCLVIVLTDLIRLSLMGWKAILLWSLVWAVVAYGSTLWLIRLSLDEINECLSIRTICILGFIESFIFSSYLFYTGKRKNMLAYYPGLMMVFPVAIVAFWMSRRVNGVNFIISGAIASATTLILLIGLTLFLRWLKSEKSWLYVASVLSLISYILIFGIL